jgi:hypothetical protein
LAVAGRSCLLEYVGLYRVGPGGREIGSAIVGKYEVLFEDSGRDMLDGGRQSGRGQLFVAFRPEDSEGVASVLVLLEDGNGTISGSRVCCRCGPGVQICSFFKSGASIVSLPFSTEGVADPSIPSAPSPGSALLGRNIENRRSSLAIWVLR